MSVKNCVRLSEADNVVVATRSIEVGDVLTTGTAEYGIAGDGVAPGHKLAIVPIARGDKIRKFGVPVGSATQDIAPGRHVHMHNVKSDYLDNVEEHYE
jgi:hypothetical protein